MCGIVSIFSYASDAGGVDREELLRIRDRMVARGPDGAGEWYSEDRRIGLGHRRLSIIDLSENGSQPMRSNDGGLVITFNGEIYNYRDIRARLEVKGFRFRSNSDTEVLLNLYADKGPDMVHDLRGMYAFAIWDERKKGLFLARDPFGIKPLYYADDGKTFRAASQIKALLAGGKIDRSPEPAGHVGYFLWGHVPEPYTMYRGIRSLPAGTWLQVDREGNKSFKRYCDIGREMAEAGKTPPSYTREEAQALLRDALNDSVRHHLIADVPVGLFLSSGLDSTTLTALAAEAGSNEVRTITLGFNEYKGTENDEVPLAEMAARHYGTSQSTIWVSRDDFKADVPRLMEAMDQPSTDGVNSYFVSKAAKQAGLKVVLSGLGGDEMFGSYPSFSQVPRMAGALGMISKAPVFGRGFRAISAPLLKRFTSPKYAGIFEYGGSYGGAYLLRRGMYMPWELPELLDSEMVRDGWMELQTLLRLEQTIEGIKNSYLKVSALEMSWYMRNQLLRDTDWASMAHSIEIRTPLVDIELLRTLAPLFYGAIVPNKRDMGRTPEKPLPLEILDKRKTGFTVPVREWLMDEKEAVGERGLRGWAKLVYSNAVGTQIESGIARYKEVVIGKRMLALVTDAYGGHGGIAAFNRNLLESLCKYPGCREVVAIPRLMPNESEPQPPRLRYVTSGLNYKGRYFLSLFKSIMRNRDIDLIVCGHINLLPLAFLSKLWTNAPLVLIIHGIDAWTPNKSRVVNLLVKKVDAFVAVSEFTKRKFLQWSGLPEEKGLILPNTFRKEDFGPGPKNPVLVEKYRLEGKTVIMTLGRIVAAERYKGFDEVLEVMPELGTIDPNIVYLIAGDGEDLPRLKEKAKRLGVEERVVFTGYIQSAEKADHYRLADLYVMPSRGEGFGIVFLEAMATGLPVIGSTIDGSLEALRNGELGTLVNPDDRKELQVAILESLKRPKGLIPDGLDYFSFDNFKNRVNIIINMIMVKTNIQK